MATWVGRHLQVSSESGAIMHLDSIDGDRLLQQRCIITNPSRHGCGHVVSLGRGRVNRRDPNLVNVHLFCSKCVRHFASSADYYR
jgi:hypothetical protein